MRFAILRSTFATIAASSRPPTLRAQRIGVPEYQLTANVWARLFLEEDHGLKASDVTWIRGGYEETGRLEKISLRLPDDVRLENAPDNRTISGMLASGEIDALIGPRAPSCFTDGHPNVRYLFDDPQKAAADWYARTKLFPIMHLLGVRRSLAEQHRMAARRGRESLREKQGGRARGS